MKRKYPALSPEAQKTDDGTWYYERRGGLEFIRYHADGGDGPEHFHVPWGMVEASVKRHQARRRAIAKAKR